MLGFGCQKHGFLFLGAHLQNQLHLIFYNFTLIKKTCALHSAEYKFFFAQFFIFLPFFPFD